MHAGSAFKFKARVHRRAVYASSYHRISYVPFFHSALSISRFWLGFLFASRCVHGRASKGPAERREYVYRKSVFYSAASGRPARLLKQALE